MTADGLVTLADRDAWFAEAGSENVGPGAYYRPGDANLDGVVDVSDFNLWIPVSSHPSPSSSVGVTAISMGTVWSMFRISMSGIPTSSLVTLPSRSGVYRRC